MSKVIETATLYNYIFSKWSEPLFRDKLNIKIRHVLNKQKILTNTGQIYSLELLLLFVQCV